MWSTQSRCVRTSDDSGRRVVRGHDARSRQATTSNRPAARSSLDRQLDAGFSYASAGWDVARRSMRMSTPESDWWTATSTVSRDRWLSHGVESALLGRTRPASSTCSSLVPAFQACPPQREPQPTCRYFADGTSLESSDGWVSVPRSRKAARSARSASGMTMGTSRGTPDDRAHIRAGVAGDAARRAITATGSHGIHRRVRRSCSIAVAACACA